MAITWILVANASLARLYEHLGPKKGLKLIKELEHPESRMKNAELSSDKAGSFQVSSDSGRGSREQQTPPKLNAARNAVFAMRRREEIGDDAFHRIEEELDWLEMAGDGRVAAE